MAQSLSTALQKDNQTGLLCAEKFPCLRVFFASTIAGGKAKRQAIQNKQGLLVYASDARAERSHAWIRR
jgi:hypothetical protein